MRTFWGCLQSDMRRAFLGGGFLVAILLTVLIQLQAVLEELFLSGGSILYYFILTRRYSWIAQLVIGFGLGVSGGNAFRGTSNEMFPQLQD